MPMPLKIDDETVPQWAVNFLIWIAVAFVGLLTGVIGWFTRKYIVKVDEHAQLIGAMSATYATIERVNEMEDKIPALVSRSEFLAYMKDFREDQLRMHADNLKAAGLTREDIARVHERVDGLYNNGRHRG
jgi:hypothetical protein